MNAQPGLQMDKAAFLAWVEGREGHYELVEGQVVTTTGNTIGHQRVVGNVLELMRRTLDHKRWFALTGLGVHIGPRTVRYPDLLVDCPGGNGRDMTAKGPALVVEVLSPSTAKNDFGDKPVEYLRLPSVAAYLILAQDEVKAWVYMRNLPAPVSVGGTDATISIPPLDLVLPIADIYDGIEFNQ